MSSHDYGTRSPGASGGEAERNAVERNAALLSEEAAFLVRQRVGRLATVSSSGEPYTVPVCYALRGEVLYIALDDKPKSVPVTRLRRVRNILENPRVSIVVDRYEEDWKRIGFLMVRGSAEMVEVGGAEHRDAVRLLRGKYHQYEDMEIETNPVIAVRISHSTSWGDLSPGEAVTGKALDTVVGRRSVRRYLDLDVPDGKLQRVLEAARWAPSPHGTQPWRLAVVRSGEAKSRLADAMGEAWTRNLQMDEQPEEVVRKRLEGSRQRLMGAPVLVLVCLYTFDLDHYPDEKRQRDEETMAVQSLGAATQNILLAAYGEGLDTGWMCAPLFTPETVVKALDLDRDLVPHALITLGYADGDPPKRRARKSLEELVVYRD